MGLPGESIIILRQKPLNFGHRKEVIRMDKDPRKNSFTTMIVELPEWERFNPSEEGTPREWALTRMMEAAKLELARIEDAKANGYEIGLTKKYIDAFKKLNNELVDRFNDLGGDAHSNYMETDPKYQD